MCALIVPSPALNLPAATGLKAKLSHLSAIDSE
jgi:hypothetical protein